MHIENAKKLIRNGAIVGFAIASLSFVYFVYLLITDPVGFQETQYGYWNFVSVAWLFVFSIGLLNRSRLSAISLFVFCVFFQAMEFAESQEIFGLFLLFVYAYFFGRAIQGTFAYHGLRQEQDPTYRPTHGMAYVFWSLAGLVNITLIGLGLVGGHDVLQRRLGDPLEPRESVAGPSGLYTLQLPDRPWVRVSPGTIGDDDSDLELYGETVETWAVVYAECGTNHTMDGLVESRRDTIREWLTNMIVSEERRILRGPFTPISHARYSGRDPTLGGENIYWVSVVVTDHARIEVIGRTTSATNDQFALEGLIKSLRLTEKAEAPCESS